MKKRAKSRGRCADRRVPAESTSVCCWCEKGFFPGEEKWVLHLMGEPAVATHVDCRPCFERWLDDESA